MNTEIKDFNCPLCGTKLPIKPDIGLQTVKCTECGSKAQVTVDQGELESLQDLPPQKQADPSDIARLVGKAANGLNAIAALGIALAVGGTTLNLMGVFKGISNRDGFFIADSVFLIFFMAILCCVYTVILVGASRMKNLRSYRWSLTAAILASLPCLSPACPLGIPFGIWAIVVLCKSQVRAEFRARRAP